MRRIVHVGRFDVEARAVVTFVLLDLVTYALLYWLVLPAFAPVLGAFDAVTQAAVGHLVSAVRLTFIGAVVVRAVRARHGLAARSEVVPTVVVAALLGFAAQLVLGVAATLAVGADPWSWLMLVNLVEWVVFALLGAVFVSPGAADRIPARYQGPGYQGAGYPGAGVPDARDRGAVSLLLLPAAAALLAVTVLAVLVVGSAANDRRRSVTAADAAALAAVDSWADALERVFDARADAGDVDTFWSFAGTDLGGVVPAGLTTSAREFARANDAELIALSIDVADASVTVRVRADDALPGSGRQVESVATARLDLLGGVCRSGRTLGYLIDGTCETRAPEPEPEPEPDPDAPPPDPDAPPPAPEPEPPFEAPDGLGAFGVRAVLVATR